MRGGMMAIGLAALAATGASAQAAGDAAVGEKIFARCGICHAIGPGAANRIGPQLNGIVGRKSATAPGFAYSAAMLGSKLVWKPAVLDTYLTAPMKVVPGTKMVFLGLPAAKDRADVIAYLAQFGSSGAKK